MRGGGGGGGGGGPEVLTPIMFHFYTDVLIGQGLSTIFDINQSHWPSLPSGDFFGVSLRNAIPTSQLFKQDSETSHFIQN